MDCRQVNSDPVTPTSWTQWYSSTHGHSAIPRVLWTSIQFHGLLRRLDQPVFLFVWIVKTQTSKLKWSYDCLVSRKLLKHSTCLRNLHTFLTVIFSFQLFICWHITLYIKTFHHNYLFVSLIWKLHRHVKTKSVTIPKEADIVNL